MKMETSIENSFAQLWKDTFRMTDGQKGKCYEKEEWEEKIYLIISWLDSSRVKECWKQHLLLATFGQFWGNWSLVMSVVAILTLLFFFWANIHCNFVCNLKHSMRQIIVFFCLSHFSHFNGVFLTRIESVISVARCLVPTKICVVCALFSSFPGLNEGHSTIFGAR